MVLQLSQRSKKQTYATMGSGCCTQQVERLIECLCSLLDTEK